MTRTAKVLTWIVVTGLAGTVVAWAQEAAAGAGGAAPATVTTPTPTPAGTAAATTSPTKKKAEAPAPDYRNALNNTLSPTGTTPTTGTGDAAGTSTLPPSRLYQAYKPIQLPSEAHIKDVLGRYSPSNPNYVKSQTSYDLMQEQLIRKQVETGLNVKLGTIATSNPGLYQQQLTQQVSSVLGDRYGVSGTDAASLGTLMTVDNNVRPAPTVFPQRGRQYVSPIGGVVNPSSGFTGSSPGLDRVARINASMGNSPDLRRFTGLENFTSRTYSNYGGYLSREYGITGTSQAYTVPRAYGYSQMNRDSQYLRDSYGINADPNRMTYSDLWRLRTSVSPR